jgi:integrase
MGKLTDKAIEKARPKAEGKESILSDGEGLQVRILQSGKKLFELRYRVHGQQTKQVLGTYPSTSLKEARQRAFEVRKQVEAGIDPKAERGRREAQRQAEALEKTVAGLYDDWMATYIRTHRKRPEQVEEFMQRDVLPHLGKLKAKSVERVQVVWIIERITQRGAMVKADRVLSLVKQMFSHGLAKGYVDHNPAAALQRKHFGIKKTNSKRYLAEPEIVELFEKLPNSGLAEWAQHALVILLATGQRTGELRQARWVEIDFEKRIWVIPPENIKTEHRKNSGAHHTVPLSNFTLRYFRRLEEKRIGEFVLESSRRPGIPIEEKTLVKAVRDRQREIPLRGRTVQCNSLLLAGGPWSPHDLRHTTHTGISGLGVPPHIVEKILNHTLPGIMAVYNHQEYFVERQQALEQWGEYLNRLQELVGTK